MPSITLLWFHGTTARFIYTELVKYDIILLKYGIRLDLEVRNKLLWRDSVQIHVLATPLTSINENISNQLVTR